jgi:nucleotide-binding universal stress UspA family protein
MARRILVAVDGSEGSRRAAEFTNEFFGRLPVELLVVNVSPTPLPWFPEVGYGIAAPYAWQPATAGEPGDRTVLLIDEAQAQAERVVAGSGIDEDDAIAEVGDPVEVIRETADAEDVDLIIVGASDKGWWSRLVEGSVSDELVRHGERPVLVVR